MNQPRYVFTPPGAQNIHAHLVGDMAGETRRIQLVFYAKDHVLADAQYDELLTFMRENGWSVRLVE